MPLPHLDGSPLIDIPEFEEITENDIYSPQCWQYNKKRIMYFDKSDNSYKICGFKLTIEQAQEFKDYYSVVPFPHDKFTGDPIYLTEEQRKEFVRKFNEDPKNNRKINLLWL